MGIRNLWKELEPASWKESIHQMALSEGYIKNDHGVRGYRVGIDASGWLYKHLFRHGQTKNPELASLYANANKIINMTMFPVFVFDGPGRPALKRGVSVRGNAHWLEAGFKTMLTAFGFPYLDAPGEAEAELAHLNRIGLIDAVWTDDSDIFVFGAKRVFRIISDDHDTMEGTIYTSYNIANHPDLHLTHDDLIFVALLAGGDYADGLPGCGSKTAVQIASSGIGRSLLGAVRTLSPTNLPNFVTQWSQYFREQLQTNSAKTLPRRYIQIVSQIPPDFPNIKIINLYLRPLTSAADGNLPHLDWHFPDLGKLASFAEDNFTWGHIPGILKHFTDTIFSGIALRELMYATLQQDGRPHSSTHVSLLDPSKPIVSARRNHSTCHMLELRIAIPISQNIVNVIQSSLHGKYGSTKLDTEAAMWVKMNGPRVRAWVPFVVMQTVYPDAVAEFEACHNRQRGISSCDLGNRNTVNNSSATGNNNAESSDIERVVIDLTESDDESTIPQAPPSSKRYTVIETEPDVLEFFTDSEGEF